MSSRLLNIRKRVYPWERHRGSVELATSLVQHRNHLTSVRVNLCNYLLPFHGWLLSLLHSSTLPRSGTCARIHLPFVNLVGALMYAETRKLKAARLTNRLCDIDSSIDRPTYYTSFPRFPHTLCPNYGQLASVYSQIYVGACAHSTWISTANIRCNFLSSLFHIRTVVNIS